MIHKVKNKGRIEEMCSAVEDYLNNEDFIVAPGIILQGEGSSKPSRIRPCTIMTPTGQKYAIVFERKWGKTYLKHDDNIPGGLAVSLLDAVVDYALEHTYQWK